MLIEQNKVKKSHWHKFDRSIGTADESAKVHQAMQLKNYQH